MKLFVALPTEILGGNLTEFWNQLSSKLVQEYKDADIGSSYTGEGSIEEADTVLFLYEFKDKESYRRDMEKCKKLGKPYNFTNALYTRDKTWLPL